MNVQVVVQNSGTTSGSTTTSGVISGTTSGSTTTI